MKNRENYESPSSKMSELSEDKLSLVFGGTEDHSILPGGSEFWHSWNPNFVVPEQNLPCWQ